MERDLDGNGRLTAAEAALDQADFQACDESGNGHLSLGEFGTYWVRTARPPDLAGVAYGASPRQVMDVYLPPASSRKSPVVLWIHGGSWKEGSRQFCPFQNLSAHGFAVVSLDYRFIDEASFPAQLDDCRSVLAWLKANQNTFGFDTDRVAALGLSAGGHLALLLGGAGEVSRVVTFGAPVDLMLPRSEGHRETLERFVGGRLEDRTELLRQASPIHAIGAEPAPCLLYHGAEDHTIPYSESLRMADAVARAGGFVTVGLVPDGSHTVVGGPRAWREIVNFLRQ
jgi:acetyl esterase/lipase